MLCIVFGAIGALLLLPIIVVIGLALYGAGASIFAE